MEKEKNIVTLLAERGRKYDEAGECIGTHNRSIIFLPKEVQPDQKVRVELREIREDSRGRIMYRAVPAPVEYTERWKDNGDGTANLVTNATDWLLKESEVGVAETRKLATREGQPSTQSNLKVVWGQNLATSIIEDAQVCLIPLEEEKVEGGQLVWKKTGERSESLSVATYSISRLEIDNCCNWYCNRLQTNYDPAVGVKVVAYFCRPDNSWEQSQNLTATWAEMPKWWQAEQGVYFPVCSCGRQRRDAQVSDGYAKCELCRAEEICYRCGKKSTVKNLGGRLVCDSCQPYEDAEQLVALSFSVTERDRIAAEAKKLLTGQAFPQAEGETILRVTADHIFDSWRKNDLLQKWAGFGWYYFCEDGIYGSKLEPAALQVLQFLPQASGNGLVELVAWLTGGSKAGSSDFYLRTQVNGESGVSLPQITENQLKQVKVAEFLRGSEADRLAALAGYQALVAKLGEESREAKAVAEILQNEKQDYVAAVAKIREAKGRDIISLPSPKPVVRPEMPATKGEPVDLSKVDLGNLFGGNGRTRR